MVSNQIRHNTVENFKENAGLALSLPTQPIPVLAFYHRSLTGRSEHGAKWHPIKVAETVGDGCQTLAK